MLWRAWLSDALAAFTPTDGSWQDHGMYSLLLYDYVDDILERRAPFREAHLALAREAHEQGILLMAGALVEPVDGGVLVFTTDDRSVVENFIAKDPYVQNGLVTAWRIRSWNVVIR